MVAGDLIKKRKIKENDSEDGENSESEVNEELGEGIETNSNGNDDDDDEEDDEQVDEEDLKFINDEEEEGEGEGSLEGDNNSPVVSSKKRRKIDDAEAKESEPEEIDELDEEDLALIEENTGIKLGIRDGSAGASSSGGGFKRLKRKTQNQEKKSKSLEDLFEEEETMATTAAAAVSADSGKSEKGRFDYEKDFDMFSDDDGEDEDEMEGFIQYDEEEGLDEKDQKALLAERRQKRRAQQLLSEDVGRSLGISKEAWRNVHDIFGDGTDYDYALQVDEESLPKEEKTFEPGWYAEQLLTDIDEKIRARDWPERLQVLPDRESSTEEEIHAEALWIYQQMLAQNESLQENQENAINSIQNVLTFLLVDGLEVPFIATQRREYYDEVLDFEDLWKILDLDARWITVLDGKTRATSQIQFLQQFYSDAEINDTKIEYQTHRLFDGPYLESLINEALTEHQVQDILDHLRNIHGETLKLATSEESSGKGLRRPTSKKSIMYDCLRTRIIEDILDLAITPREFAVNLFENYAKNVKEELMGDKTMPELYDVLSKTLGDQGFKDFDHANKALVLILALNISSDPNVRKILFPVFERGAYLNVRPTDKGRTEIDKYSELAPYKYITEKPVREVFDETFALLLLGEKHGLIDIEVRLDESGNILDSFRSLYSGSIDKSASNASEELMDLRVSAIDLAFKKYLFPLFQRRIRESLAKRAYEHVKGGCYEAFLTKLMVGPVNEKTEDGLHRIVSVSCGDGSPNTATVAVIVNEQGQFVDHIKLPPLSSFGPNDLVKKQQEFFHVLGEFLQRYAPDVIGVSGTSLASRNLHRDLKQLISSGRYSPLNDHQSDAKKSSKRNQQTLSRMKNPSPRILWVDDDVARIYSNSNEGRTEFPKHSPLLLYCISLARRLQEPLTEFSAVPIDDLRRGLNLHPLQEILPIDIAKMPIEKALVSMVNLVGVDINQALRQRHFSRLLQYVCGFGPRKAKGIVARYETISNEGPIENRSQLASRLGLKRNVFINCATTFIVGPRLLGNSDNYDLLDRTRIHPENYVLARKMANETLDIVDEKGEDNEEQGNELANEFASATISDNGILEQIFEDPSQLDKLMLDDYAQVLLEEKGLQKRSVLSDIKDEFKSPYQERRTGYVEPSHERLFEMLTGETDRTLFVGQLVSIVITKVMEQKGTINCCLEGGSRIPGNVNGVNPMSVSPGMSLQVRIRDISKENFFVHFVSVSEAEEREAIGSLSASTFGYDPAYDIEAAKADEKLLLEAGKAQKKPVAREDQQEDEAVKAALPRNSRKRFVAHPLFKNVNKNEAVKLLEEAPIGDMIIRPSFSRNDVLIMTWKVLARVYANVEIKELQKPNNWTLGKKLVVVDGARKAETLNERDCEGMEQYEDIDEIHSRYLLPLIEYHNEARHHEKYISQIIAARSSTANDKEALETIYAGKATEHESLEFVEERLRELKAIDVKRIPYIFSHSFKLPGKLIISYLPATTVKHEYVSVLASGFKFRQQVFEALPELIGWFKRHYRDMIPMGDQLPQVNVARESENTAAYGFNDSTNLVNPYGVVDEYAEHQPSMIGATNRPYEYTADQSPGFPGGRTSRGNFDSTTSSRSVDFDPNPTTTNHNDDMTMSRGGNFRGSGFRGGEFRGRGGFRGGGEFRGDFRGNSFRGRGEFRGGFRGDRGDYRGGHRGNYRGGNYRGGNSRGGDIRGGDFRGGHQGQ